MQALDNLAAFGVEGGGGGQREGRKYLENSNAKHHERDITSFPESQKTTFRKVAELSAKRRHIDLLDFRHHLLDYLYSTQDEQPTNEHATQHASTWAERVISVRNTTLSTSSTSLNYRQE